MALSRLVASLLLLSLLAVASADSSYGSYQKPEYVVENHNDDHKEIGNLVGHVHKQVENLIHPAQPGSGYVHTEEYKYQSEQGYQHSQQDIKPTVPEGHENYMPTKYFDGQKPKSDGHDYQSHGINYIVIQGNILCKSGISSNVGISGAIVKIICPGSNVYGYEYAPFSISSVANEHGYYCATYPVSKLPMGDWNQLVKGCHVIPVSSPMAICNLPNLIGGGSDGAYVSYSRTTGDKAYYNAGNVFFTPASSYDYPKQPTIPKETSLPAGGGY